MYGAERVSYGFVPAIPVEHGTRGLNRLLDHNATHEKDIMTDDRESANTPTDGPSGSAEPEFPGNRDRKGFGRPGDEPGPQFQGPDFSSPGEAGQGTSQRGAAQQGDSQGGFSMPKNPISALERGNLPLQMAKMWIQDNQTTAMLGAFAVGAFVGAILRD